MHVCDILFRPAISKLCLMLSCQPEAPRPHLINDDGLEYKRNRNINIAALVIIVLCNTFVARCPRQLII